MPTLVDTSVWVDHLRHGNAKLATLLEGGSVCCHPFVIGELACGTLRNRNEVLALLGTLPQSALAEHEEVLTFVAQRKLAGRGLGWVDMHLLASALIGRCRLWTLDKALGAAAIGLDLVLRDGDPTQPL
jgi:predicted nucleic acid-binding protein